MPSPKKYPTDQERLAVVETLLSQLQKSIMTLNTQNEKQFNAISKQLEHINTKMGAVSDMQYRIDKIEKEQVTISDTLDKLDDRVKSLEFSLSIIKWVGSVATALLGFLVQQYISNNLFN